jgi:hypothetical protein
MLSGQHSFRFTGYVLFISRTVVNDELERTWKELFVANFELLSRHAFRGADKNHGKPYHVN